MRFHKPRGKKQKDFVRLIEDNSLLEVEGIYWNYFTWYIKIRGLNYNLPINYWGGIDRILEDFKHDCKFKDRYAGATRQHRCIHRSIKPEIICLNHVRRNILSGCLIVSKKKNF